MMKKIIPLFTTLLLLGWSMNAWSCQLFSMMMRGRSLRKSGSSDRVLSSTT